jgi:hypothetical protein
MSDLKAPTYEDRHAPVGRAFTVRQPSFREATFSTGGGAPKMSDLKAPTYKYHSPVGRAFTVRQPSFREATFSRDGGVPKMSDLKAPTYKYQSRPTKTRMNTGMRGVGLLRVGQQAVEHLLVDQQLGRCVGAARIDGVGVAILVDHRAGVGPLAFAQHQLVMG